MPEKEGFSVYLIDPDTKEPIPEVTEAYFNDGIPTAIVKPGMKIQLCVKVPNGVDEEKYKLRKSARCEWRVRVFFNKQWMTKKGSSYLDSDQEIIYEEFACKAGEPYQQFVYGITERKAVATTEKKEVVAIREEAQMIIAVKLAAGTGKWKTSKLTNTDDKNTQQIQNSEKNKFVNVIHYVESDKIYSAPDVYFQCMAKEVKEIKKAQKKRKVGANVKKLSREYYFSCRGRKDVIRIRCDTQENIDLRKANHKEKQKKELKIEPRPQEDMEGVEEGVAPIRPPPEVIDLTMEELQQPSHQKCQECGDEVKDVPYCEPCLALRKLQEEQANRKRKHREQSDDSEQPGAPKKVKSEPLP